MGPLSPDLPTVEVTSRAEWRNWLTEHHHQTTGVWVVTRKKGAVRTDGVYVSAQDINEGCLCFGWIDSKPAKIDHERTGLLCTGSGRRRSSRLLRNVVVGAGPVG
jgi:uncharacterized protein YdeI (YjbR/CyaY-like superfamily)